jgi:hypothetical protein
MEASTDWVEQNRDLFGEIDIGNFGHILIITIFKENYNNKRNPCLLSGRSMREIAPTGFFG